MYVSKFQMMSNNFCTSTEAALNYTYLQACQNTQKLTLDNCSNSGLSLTQVELEN